MEHKLEFKQYIGVLTEKDLERYPTIGIYFKNSKEVRDSIITQEEYRQQELIKIIEQKKKEKSSNDNFERIIKEKTDPKNKLKEKLRLMKLRRKKKNKK